MNFAITCLCKAGKEKVVEYQEFKNHIEKYYDLYENGLKKQANKYMDDFVKEIQIQDDIGKDTILYRFTQELCDGKEYEYLKERGNGRIPFVFEQYLRTWLYKRCLENKVPELRWFYELFCQDKTGCEYAFAFLKKAYESKECDTKTVNLLFASYLDVLGWGAHHFPNSCIITAEVRNDAFSKCKIILSEKEVDNRLQAQLKYYEILYLCYDNYVNDDKEKDFNQYCKEANLPFYESKAYYFGA